jgi:hypothetical protein
MRRGEHDAADALVVAGGFEGPGQVVEQLIRERVARVGLIEGDGRDAVRADVVENRVVRHAAEFYYRAASTALEEA